MARGARLAPSRRRGRYAVSQTLTTSGTARSSKASIMTGRGWGFCHRPHHGVAAEEPLQEFPCGALVPFAVSNAEVWMSTRLRGAPTVVLAFNLGEGGGTGNPPNPNGQPTAYL